jgi:hypothetical protein
MLTVEGVRYTGLTYISHDASRLRVAHDGGQAELKISELPIGLRFQLGYSEQRAARAEAERGREVEDKRPAVTPEEIRARAAERRRQAAIERVERDRQNLERQRGQIREPSALASHEEKEAFRAHQITKAIQRGEATVADLPEEYGGRPTGTSSRAIAAQKAWDKAYAIEEENRLMREGRTAEAAALRQARLQQEANEALKKIEADTKKLREEAELERWLKDTGQSR